MSARGGLQQPLRLVALDLDGVVWRGAQMLPGAPEALADVVARGLDLRYVTNNSTTHREVVSERLAGLGLPAGPERVLSSAFVTAWYLHERFPAGARVMALGEEGLLRELKEAGLDAYYADDATFDSPPPAAVAVGMDRRFSYDTLAKAQWAIAGGALFVATNRDATFPTPGRLAPGAGAIVAALATASGQEPLVMGKPEAALANTLASVTGVSPGQTLFVGDRLETDIAMARNAGMISALVLTGVSTEADLHEAEARDNALLPDYVLPDLSGLSGLLDSLGT